MSEISEEVIERLEAEAMVSDAEPEELTIAVESEMENREESIEELQAQVDEKEAQVEELQETIESKDETIEELQDEVQTVAQTYAEELAQDSGVLDADDFLERFEIEELREKHDALDTSSSPAPASGDPGASVQQVENGDGETGEEEEEEELSEKAEVAADQFRQRARQTGKQYWDELANSIEEEGLGAVQTPEDQSPFDR